MINIQILDNYGIGEGDEFKQFPLPHYAHDGDAGFDLRACGVTKEFEHQTSGNKINIYPGQTVIVRTGIKTAVPPGCAGLITPRSGKGCKEGLTPGNSPGIIDLYRGEIMVCLYNRNPHLTQIELGDKIAQMVVVPVVNDGVRIVDELDNTERGDNGFGSTG